MKLEYADFGICRGVLEQIPYGYQGEREKERKKRSLFPIHHKTQKFPSVFLAQPLDFYTVIVLSKYPMAEKNDLVFGDPPTLPISLFSIPVT